MTSRPIMIDPSQDSTPGRRPRHWFAAELAEAGEAVVDEGEPAIHRHEQPEQGYVADERERSAQQKKLALMAAYDLGDLGGGGVFRQGIVTEHALVEIAEQNHRQHRP